MFGSPAPTRRSRPALRRFSGGLATALLLAAGATACTGGDKDEEESPAGATPEPVAVEVTVDRVSGTLRPKARKKLVAAVGGVLRGYVDSGFLGTYPRTDFGDAFADFTSSAAKDARKDRDLLTGAGFKDAKSVSAESLTARLAVFSPESHPAGATARIRFDLQVDGRPVTVAGRLLLTPVESGWKVFGYDVHRGDVGSTGGNG